MSTRTRIFPRRIASYRSLERSPSGTLAGPYCGGYGAIFFPLFPYRLCYMRGCFQFVCWNIVARGAESHRHALLSRVPWWTTKSLLWITIQRSIVVENSAKVKVLDLLFLRCSPCRNSSMRKQQNGTFLHLLLCRRTSLNGSCVLVEVFFHGLACQAVHATA